MPLVRQELKNEYGLGNPELYRVTEKDDSKTLLEGVAVSGLVGILRQLADLAEFASEIFHDLHEQMLETTSRSQDMMIRVQQLEEAIPSLEKVALTQTTHLQFAHTAGSYWHVSFQTEENHVTRGDLPCFIKHVYEECRGPPNLFLLDKYDVGGGGACLKRYSDPSFFKMEWATTEIMKAEKLKKEMKALRSKKKMRNQKSRGAPHSGPLTRNHNLAFDASGFDASIPTMEGNSTFSMASMTDKVIRSQSFNSRSKTSYMESLLDANTPSGYGNVEIDALTNSISKPSRTTVVTSVISGNTSLTGAEVHQEETVDSDTPDPRAGLILENSSTDLENYVDARNTMEPEGESDYDCGLKREKECHCEGTEIISRIDNQELLFSSSASDVGTTSSNKEDFIHVPENKNPTDRHSLGMAEDETISQDYKIVEGTFSISDPNGDIGSPSTINLVETNDSTGEASVYQQFCEHSPISRDCESIPDGAPIDVIREVVRKQEDEEHAVSTSASPVKQIFELDSSKDVPSPKSHHSDCSSPRLEHMDISFLPMNGLDSCTLNPYLSDVHDLEGSVTLKPIESEIESDDDTFGKPSLDFSEDMLSQEWESNSERWECNQVNAQDNDMRYNLHRNSSANSVNSSYLIEETSMKVVSSDSSHLHNGEIMHHHSMSRKSSAAGSLDLSTNSTTGSSRLEETSMHLIRADFSNVSSVTGKCKLPKSRKSSAGSVDFSSKRVSNSLVLEKTSRNSVEPEYLYEVNDEEWCKHSKSKRSTAGSTDLSGNSLSIHLEFEETKKHLLEREHLYHAKGTERSTQLRSRRNSTASSVNLSVDSISSFSGLEERSEHIELDCQDEIKDGIIEKNNHILEREHLYQVKDAERSTQLRSRRNSTASSVNLSVDSLSSCLGLQETSGHVLSDSLDEIKDERVEETNNHILEREHLYQTKDVERSTHSRSRKSSTARSVNLSVDSISNCLGLEEKSEHVESDSLNEIKDEHVEGTCKHLVERELFYQDKDAEKSVSSRSRKGSPVISENLSVDSVSNSLGIENRSEPVISENLSVDSISSSLQIENRSEHVESGCLNEIKDEHAETSKHLLEQEYLYRAKDAEMSAESRRTSTARSVDLSVESVSSSLGIEQRSEGVESGYLNVIKDEFVETHQHLLEHEPLYQAKDYEMSNQSRSRKSSTARSVNLSVESISGSLGVEERSEPVESGCPNEIKVDHRVYHVKSKKNSIDELINLSGNPVSGSLGFVETVDLPIRQKCPYEENKDARNPNKSNSRRSSTAGSVDFLGESVSSSIGLIERSTQLTTPDCRNDVKETPMHQHSRSRKSSLTGSVDHKDYGIQVSQNDLQENDLAKKQPPEFPHAVASPPLPPPPPPPPPPPLRWGPKSLPVFSSLQEIQPVVNPLLDVQESKSVALDKAKPVASSPILHSTSLDEITLKKPSMLSRSPAVQKPDDRDSILQQIRTQSFCLRRTDTISRPTLFLPRTATNIKVAAILEKANAIRQAFAGSDDGDDDQENWSDD